MTQSTARLCGPTGAESLPKEFGPINLQAGEIFKIRGGKIQANGVLVPYGPRTEWD